jgi:hypothetical protein
MSALRPHRIHLLGDGRHEEGIASGVIRPGDLLAVTNDDASAPRLKYIRHADAGGVAERAFALEDALQGRSIDTNYADGEVVSLVLAEPGDVVFATLAVGENVETGDALTSNGDGTLKVSSSDAPIAIALEAMDLSDSDTDGDTRIRVRIL